MHVGTQTSTQTQNYRQQSYAQHASSVETRFQSYMTQDATGATQAVGQLTQIATQDSWSVGRGGGQPDCIPAPGMLPPPQPSYGAAPAGRGLATGEEGWPESAVSTAGGYHVVPEGATNWSIYAPGQVSTDTPNTRVWGDPHVTEKDGTRWDFTKNSDFVLPDGTRINVETSAETGQSVSKALNIVNGADRVRIDGVDGAPTVSPISHDGYEWRGAHVASDPSRDTFRLAGDQNNVNWVRERNGRAEGVVTGAQFDPTTNRYEQNVDPTLIATTSPTMTPPFGSRAWGNAMRSDTVDAVSQMTGNPWIAADFGGQVRRDHDLGAWQQDVRDYYNAGFDRVGMMMQLMQAERDWRRQIFDGQMNFVGGPAQRMSGFTFNG